MSRSIVRRLTAAALVLTVLCFALPAAAAPASRSHTSRTPVVLGPGLLDQVLAWLGSFWPGKTPAPQGSREKAGIATGGGVLDSSSTGAETDRGAMIDPNGSH
jgi:hypothetical protein